MNEMNNNIPQVNAKEQPNTIPSGTNSSPSSIDPNTNVQNSTSTLNTISPQSAPTQSIHSTSTINADPGTNLANNLTDNSTSSSAPKVNIPPNISGGGNTASNPESIPPVSSLMKEQSTPNRSPKKTKSPLLAIFVFFILGGFIFGLPYINEYKQARETKKQQAALEEQLRKEEEAQEQAEAERQEALEEEKKIKTSTCTLPSSNQATFTLNETQTFEYKEDKIVTVSIATSRTYLQEDAEYEAMKLTCQTQADPLSTPSQEGYSIDCEIDNLTITLTESYDLETFEPFTTSTGESKVAPYRYQQSFSEIQKTLEVSQAVCK